MSDVLRNTESDLAFMKALVEGDHRVPEGFGAIYAMTGLVYGLEVLAGSFQVNGAAGHTSLNWSLIHIGFSVAYVVVLAIMTRIYRSSTGGSGVTARTFGAIFGAVGSAMLTVVVILALTSWRMEDWYPVLAIPAIGCAMQGAAWFAAYWVRRQSWLGLIAAGWFAAAIGVSLTIPTPAFLLIMGAAFLLLMVVPGIAIMRNARAG